MTMKTLSPDDARPGLLVTPYNQRNPDHYWPGMQYRGLPFVIKHFEQPFLILDPITIAGVPGPAVLTANINDVDFLILSQAYKDVFVVTATQNVARAHEILNEWQRTGSPPPGLPEP